MSNHATTQMSDNRLDAVFSALADPTRRRIMMRLAKGPAYVGELAEPFSMSLPAISKHLRVLESAGLLRRQWSGRTRRCWLDAGPLADADEFVKTYRVFWEGNLDQLAEYLEKEDVDNAED